MKSVSKMVHALVVAATLVVALPPARAERLFSDGFETGYSNWNEAGPDNQITTAVAYQSTYSSRVPAQPNGGVNVILLKSIPEREQIWVRLRAYFDPSWSTPNTQGIHLIRIAWEQGADRRVIDFNVPVAESQIQFFHFVQGAAVGGEVAELIGWEPQNNKGSWLLLTLWAKLNTPGQSPPDGEFKFWVGGPTSSQPVYHKTGLNYRGGAAQGWNQINAQSNPGYNGTQWPIGEWWAIDNVEIWDSDPDAVSSPGLTAAYSFNAGSGTTLIDSSGNNHHGTIVDATWTAGKYNSALSFDGVSGDKVSLGTALNVSLPFTVEAWIYPTSYADWRAIFSKRDTPPASDMRFDVGLTIDEPGYPGGAVYVYTGFTPPDSYAFLASSYVPPLNTWTHLAVVVSSTGAVTLYANAVPQQPQPLGTITLGTDTTAQVTIGNTGDNLDRFAGRIDELRVYNRALSQGEIQTDMNTPIGP